MEKTHETVKDEGEKDKREENSWVRERKMGKWDNKLETEMGLWHDLLDRQDIRELSQLMFLCKKMEINKFAEPKDVLTHNKCL